MMQAPQPLDIVAVAVAVATVLFGPQMAAIIGPYAVIFLGAVVGAIWSASGRPQTGRWNMLWYAFGVILLSLCVTVTAAEIVAPYIPRLTEPRYLFFPVAMVISGIGDKWPNVLRWAVALGRTILERRAGATPNEPPPGGPQ